MNESTAVLPGFNKQEPIAGYITKELIGSGGCGEVWKCHAPGGLLKAVKIVYGALNSKRASRELRSLNRIKEVRHAFLLSIERIEVVDNTLMIVMELADQSLKQCFEKYRENGYCGIPRTELLGYLRDAADALDYIYDNYSLQHLDVKPENLLLVANRAKVADFGLIKNLYDRTASMIEGLTPIYSPPELFEGKPNRHSDQYSLAIVYQEMLSGELPFDGATAAHLASQHLHTPPSLVGLPKWEQPIIARALSKNPDERFPSCRALIEALTAASGDSDEKASSTGATRPLSAAGPVLKTESLTGGIPVAAPLPSQATTQSSPKRQLPDIDLTDEGTATYGPALFIGVGGAATQTLRRLRRRLCDRLGAMDDIPAISMLLLDTDVDNLNRATQGEIGTALSVNETLAMPLRRSEDYRANSETLLHSVSRRWLYNIPFSLQTDGFRPLGRLAMVDHFKRLQERLREVLTKTTSEASVAKTAGHTGLEFDAKQPRIYIVASVSGGTGGGMVLEVAYAVRMILAELHLSDENVCGILLHSTPRAGGERDKSIANSYATLNELWHYSRPGFSYPGDRSCGLQAFHGNNRTFSNCYFMHLGDDLNQSRLHAATDPIAEYLYCSAVTPAGRFLDKCRQLERVALEADSSEPLARTFGLCQLGGSNSDIPTTVAEVLCRDLVCSWRSGVSVDVERSMPRLSETLALIAAHDQPKQERFTELDELADAKATELELDFDRMQLIARELLDQEVSADVDSYFTKLIGDACGSTQAARGDLARVFTLVDAVLGDGGGGEADSESSFDSLGAVLDTRLEIRASKLAMSLRDWIFDLVDKSSTHVEGAKHAAEWFQDYLRAIERDATVSVNQSREETRALKEAVLFEQSNRQASGARLDARWLGQSQARICEYARLRLQQVIASSVVHWLRIVESQITATLDKLQEFWRDLNKFASEFQAAPALTELSERRGETNVVDSHWRSLLDNLMKHRKELVVALDQAIEKDPAIGAGKLRRCLTQNVNIQSEFSLLLRAAARQLILRTMGALNLSRPTNDGRGSTDLASGDLLRCVEATRATLPLEESAASRLLVILPKGADPQQCRDSLAHGEISAATVVPSTEGDLIVCREFEQIHLRSVAAQLVANRSDYVELAKRLHSRIDVDWDDMSTGGSPRRK